MKEKQKEYLLILGLFLYDRERMRRRKLLPEKWRKMQRLSVKGQNQVMEGNRNVMNFSIWQ